MTSIPTTNQFMRTVNPEMVLHQRSGRLEEVAMFRISAKTCRKFTLAEIFIMAAMNIETSRVAARIQGRNQTSAAQKA